MPLAPIAAERPAAVARKDIQRTLAIVVDDLGLSMGRGFAACSARCIRLSIATSSPPTWLASSGRSGTSGGLQPFTTDRRVLHAMIDGLHWDGASRNGVEPFEAQNSWVTFDPRTSD